MGEVESDGKKKYVRACFFNSLFLGVLSSTVLLMVSHVNCLLFPPFCLPLTIIHSSNRTALSLSSMSVTAACGERSSNDHTHHQYSVSSPSRTPLSLPFDQSLYELCGVDQFSHCVAFGPFVTRLLCST